MRLLVLEDDVRLCQAYARRLRDEGHAVDEVGSIGEARLALADVDYDCVVFDRLVPDGDAIALVDEVCDGGDGPSVLVLSALGAPDERVEGLTRGADDYVPKPVRLEELALRVRRLLVRGPPPVRQVELGRVVIDPARREVRVDGSPVRLTARQYAVLEYLVVNRHRMVTTEELLEHCWDRNRALFSNPLHSQVSRLRRAFRGLLRIESVRGEGYLLQMPADADVAGRVQGSQATCRAEES